VPILRAAMPSDQRGSLVAVACPRSSRRRDRRVAAAERVLMTPLLMAVLMLIVVASRLLQARLEVESAVMQAARAVSLAWTVGTAAADAYATARVGEDHLRRAGTAAYPSSQTITFSFILPIDVNCGDPVGSAIPRASSTRPSA
jgi:hypothetical protein